MTDLFSHMISGHEVDKIIWLLGEGGNGISEEPFAWYDEEDWW